MYRSSVKFVKRNVKRVLRRVSHFKSILTDPAPKLLVPVYHRVVKDAVTDPLGIMVQEAVFVRQLDDLAKRYTIISLDDAIRQSKRGDVGAEHQIVLTFDDGYRDNYDIVYPILKKKGIPATFYIPTNYIGSDRPLWELEVISGISRSPSINSVQLEGVAIYKKRFESNVSFALRVFKKMKGLNIGALHSMVDGLRSRADLKDFHDYSRDTCMTWEQVCELSRNGIEIGSHGATHCSLARISSEDAFKEMVESKRAIEIKTCRSCRSFAFPFGSAMDYNDLLIDHAREAGFTSCMLNVNGYNHISNALFAYKRIIMNEHTDLSCLFG